ncbi:ComF family protein [Cumulibacter soli]|uniref:ComF family protein n=1 Tax=Cumulibacter soli TaxID=2546344 RepID=UPI001068A35A|nr:phosphoribosyltransferase family protein [Cumulibacter soli]
MWRAGSDLVLPVRCLGCDRRAYAWCQQCRSDALALQLREHPGGLRTVAACSYDGDVREALLGYKERGRRDLAAPIGWLLQAAIDAARDGLGDPVLVPMPSTSRAVRARGGDHMVRLLRALPAPRPIVIALGARAGDDSVELSASGRRMARGTSMYARRRVRELVGERDVLLVDDIVTTGSTLEKAHSLLRSAGARTIRAAVVAQTPKQVS